MSLPADIVDDSSPPPPSSRAVQRSRVRALHMVRQITGLVGQSSSGLLAAAVSSLCCIPIAVAFALGLGGSATLVGFTRYRPVFLVVGLAGALIAVWWGLRRSSRCCPPRTHRRNRLLIPVLTFGTFAISYYAINDWVLPWLYTLG